MSDHLALVVGVARLPLGAAAPVGGSGAPNATQYAPPWVDEPSTRGTWTVLYSCMFTIGLCVWSAIHLNIPARGEPASRQFWRKVKWVFVAILAPEFVLFCAWSQFYQARKLCAELNRLKQRDESEVDPEKDQPGSAERRGSTNAPAGLASCMSWVRSCVRRRKQSSAFSIVYGYYAVMGGFIVDVRDVYDHADFMTLTTRSIMELAKRSSWKHFEVSEDTIHDKSKADSLVKLLVFLQVTWNIFQCVSRAALRYPLSILEIHTLIHALCALSMYMLWFRKPFDVKAATLVDSSLFADDLALLLLRTPLYAPPLWESSDYMTRYGQYRLEGCGFREKIAYMSPHRDDAEENMMLLDTARLRKKSSKQVPIINKINAVDTSKYQNAEDADFEATTFHSLFDFLNLTDEPRRGAATYLSPDAGSNERENSQAVNGETTSQHLGLATEGEGVTSDQPAAAFSIVPLPGIETFTTIKTGQTFSSGIGPSGIDITFRDDGLMQKYDTWRVRGDSHFRYCLSVSLSKKDFVRWQRAAAALRREELGTNGLPRVMSLGEREHYVKNINRDVESLGPAFQVPYLVSRAPNFDKSLFVALENRYIIWRLLYCFGTISAIYAAVHLALWNFDFPSRIEALFWKTAACVMAAPIVLIIFADLWLFVKHLCGSLARDMRELRAVIVLSAYSELIYYAYGGTIFLLGGIYVVSRVYIVVESFISLRHVPSGVYEDTSWSQYFPHF